MYSPAQLSRRFRVVLVFELLLLALFVGTLMLWNRMRHHTSRLQREIRLHAEQTLTMVCCW